MSNPSGTGHDPHEPQPSHTENPSPDLSDNGLSDNGLSDSDPVTEVIDVVVAADPADTSDTPHSADPADAAVAEERRYTAPGFDAGSTQIIDRVPDPPTEFITTPTELSEAAYQAAYTGPIDTSRPRTGPQEILPARKARPRWLRPVAVVAAVLVGAALIGLFLVHRSNAAKASRENLVRTTIETFDTAVRDGDLATLRTITCGQTRDSYVNYDDQAWADTYEKVAAAKQYPVVASIDQVVVNGDHAEANVTSYMAYDPATTSTRSFDLQFRDDQWKICQAS
jgi:hypothetical protein